MIDTNKFVHKHYYENRKSKDWMDKNLKPQDQSGFIRLAVAEKITKIKSKK